MPKKKTATTAEKIYAQLAADAPSAAFGIEMKDIEKLITRHGSSRLTTAVSRGATIYIRTDSENTFTNAIMVKSGVPIVGTAKRNRYAASADPSIPKRGALIAMTRLMNEVAGKTAKDEKEERVSTKVSAG